MNWFLVLGQIQQVVDVSTVAGMSAVISVHVHTWLQTRSLNKHVDAKIAVVDEKLTKHLKDHQ